MVSINRYICLFLAIFCISVSSYAIRLEKKTVNDVENYYYVIAPEDDIFSLAEKLGITTEDIIKYNSWVKGGFVAKKKLYFPVKEFAPVFETLDNIEIADAGDEIESQNNQVSEFIFAPTSPDELWRTPAEERQLSVIVCQPFMLEQTKLSATAQSATDFYRGFLLGIDSLRAAYNFPQMRIVAVDCGNDVTAVLNRYPKGFKSGDIIIAPENQKQLTILEDFGRENEVYILNILQARDDDYLTNPYAMQGNIPTEMMYDKAIQWFIDNLNGAMPVVLDNIKGKKDKQPFVTRLTDRLNNEGIQYKTVSYAGTLAWNPLIKALGEIGSDMVFIPTSASVSDFQKFTDVLLKLKNALTGEMKSGYDIRLFGYPEYLTYNGQDLNNLKKIDTTFYTRFYNGPESDEVRKIESSYYNRYGLSLPGGYPNMALLGFDVARYLIALASQNVLSAEVITDMTTVEGVQTSYNFTAPRKENGGLVNENLYLITLSDTAVPRIEIR